jgi:transcriptional regulator with XRE-family HTH domain
MMTPHEAISARKTMGLTQTSLAAEFGLTPSIITAWEAGSVNVPKRFEDQLRYRAAGVEREAALAVSGLPECELDKALENEAVPEKIEAQVKHLERVVNHRASCSVCQARDKFILDRFGPMPPVPMSTSLRLLGWVSDRTEKLPRWAQPAVWVGLSFGGYSVFKIVFMLPRLARNPQFLWVPFAGLALSISIGAVIGLIYGAFRALRERNRA